MIELVTLTVVIAIMMFFVMGILIVDYSKNKKDYEDGNWVFTNFWTNLYPVLFKEDEIKIAKKFGIHTDEYLSNCRAGGIKPNLKRYIMCYLGAILILFVTAIISMVLLIKEFNVIIIGCIAVMGFLFCVCTMESEKNKAQSASKKCKEKIVDEMPRFLDLVEAALYIGIPVDQALMLAAESIPGIISDELKKAADEASRTDKSWQDSLRDLSEKYNVDVLTNFVLDVTTSYKKGINIYESVTRQNTYAKQAKLMDVEAKVSKTKTIVLFPVALFKLLPIILMFIIPVMGMLEGF